MPLCQVIFMTACTRMSRVKNGNMAGISLAGIIVMTKVVMC